jgi:hypothetical protein
MTHWMVSRVENMQASIDNQKETAQKDLDNTIDEVKDEFRKFLIRREELIIKLGEALEAVSSDPQSISKEIKQYLKEEIAEKLVSRRDIERYCPDKWKKNTRPKNEKKNDNLSFSKEKNVPVMTVATSGKVNTELEHDDTNENIADLNSENVDEIEYIDIKNTSEFELWFHFDTMQKYMADEFKTHKGSEPVWIHGTIDKFTGKIINAELGRIPNRH